MKKIIIIFILIFNFVEAYSQAPLGEIDEEYYLPGMDTVMTTRSYGEWWFGITGGVNGDLYFGDFFLPERPYLPVDDLNLMIDFPSSLGAGLFLGLFGEWIPVKSNWGVNLNIFLLDFRSSSTESEPDNELFNTHYQSTYSNYYISISPSAVYNTSIDGLHLYGGFDTEINISSIITHRKTFDNSAEIDHDMRFDSSSFASRFGFHFGAGYDILIGYMKNNMRALMTPYIMLHGGTNSFTDYSSSRNQLMVRAGVSIKIGFDNVERDTLLFDPNYKPPTAIIASALNDEEIEFLYPKQAFEPSELAVVQKPVTPEEPSIAVATAELDAKEELFIPPNDAKRITFNSNLTNDDKQYLDALADYLKRNTRTRIAVRGYSDGLGTLQEITKKSRDRANVVFDYLVNVKKANRTQVLVSGEGNIPSVGDDRTSAGRAANRRVEIQIP